MVSVDGDGGRREGEGGVKSQKIKIRSLENNLWQALKVPFKQTLTRRCRKWEQ